MTQMIETIRKEFLTVEDVSRYTSLPVRTIRKMAKGGLIDYYRPVPGETTRMYFKRADIDAYMMNCRVPAKVELGEACGCAQGTVSNDNDMED